MLPGFVRPKMFAFVACIALPTTSASQAATTVANPAVPYLETSGLGERRVAPDRATVMIDVTTRATSAAVAAADNARIQQRVMDTLRVLGFGNAMTTPSYNVGRDYEPDTLGRPSRLGYAARGSIRVRLTDLNSIGKVIDAALARGATGVGGVFFESSAAETTRRAAMAEAAATARADAEALARALGGQLGPIISVTTTAPDRFREMMMVRTTSAYAGGSATQMIPSELVIASTVLVRWQFIAPR